MAARSKTASVKQEALSSTASFLTELPEKPKEDLSLREAIKQMHPLLSAALAKGYSYEDLAKILTDRDIKISALTLRNYLPAGKRQSAKAVRRPRKAANQEPEAVADDPNSASSGAVSAPASENGTASTHSQDAAPVAAATTTPTKSRRGRAKAAPEAAIDDGASNNPTRARRSSPAKSSATKKRSQSKASK